VFLSFIELLGLLVESAPRCANCHDTEHSTAACPHFPASFTHEAALGYLPPPTTAGTFGSGKKGTKRQRPSRSNKSNKPAAAAGAAPPSGARPCRFGVNCLPQQAHDLQIYALSRPLGRVGGSFIMLLPPAILSPYL